MPLWPLLEAQNNIQERTIEGLGVSGPRLPATPQRSEIVLDTAQLLDLIGECEGTTDHHTLRLVVRLLEVPRHGEVATRLRDDAPSSDLHGSHAGAGIVKDLVEEAERSAVVQQPIGHDTPACGHKGWLAEADGNRTRLARVPGHTGFEDREGHQPPERLR
jgi:hypothetical protein